ncbi:MULTISPECIES: DUF3006 domain-containing protein [unclassified Clostridium]|uniref:DUF3006 domain-containing protein n=1 Tax=unclassified Clostridium TaxID=2614128 RepID=UPI0013F97044|nr:MULTISPECIES: DUF3006 domain-containing protein [unclassified Clostridium]MBN1046715.1 DUF3006 domain-containing protein [Clostridium botulinum]MBN1056601.1 DUF3006 domain-containing protein [Clostridium botulinum]MBN1069110.1 DUF3006 domain-containing protein [Clostridium botulinum]NFI02923.1 DUF3006 domain-containing protein [Clostridium botulinum]NFN94132.1 DUF3006 domain-containing protein [Clostridium botulinum]
MGNKYIVDRIEENHVILQSFNGDMLDIMRSKTKGDIKDGDVLIKNGDIFIIDVEETLKRKQAINKMMKNMWK